MGGRVLCLGYLFHRVDVTVLLLLHLPHPAEAARAHLVEKLVVVSVLVPKFDGLAVEGGGDVGVVIGVEGSLVRVLLD